MPVDVLNHRLGKIRDNGDIDFDNTMAAVDIDSELQEKFLFFPIEELEQLIRDELEEGRDRFVLGSGPEHCAASIHENPQWLLNHARNALALYWKLMEDQKLAEHEAEKLERRPEPGVYQGTHTGNKHFTVLVTEDRRVLVGQSTGGFDDYTTQWDQHAATSLAWTLQRIDITDGTISA
jgi:hypothetical protein